MELLFLNAFFTLVRLSMQKRFPKKTYNSFSTFWVACFSTGSRGQLAGSEMFVFLFPDEKLRQARSGWEISFIIIIVIVFVIIFVLIIIIVIVFAITIIILVVFNINITIIFIFVRLSIVQGKFEVDKRSILITITVVDINHWCCWNHPLYSMIDFPLPLCAILTRLQLLLRRWFKILFERRYFATFFLLWIFDPKKVMDILPLRFTVT